MAASLPAFCIVNFGFVTPVLKAAFYGILLQHLWNFQTLKQLQHPNEF